LKAWPSLDRLTTFVTRPVIYIAYAAAVPDDRSADVTVLSTYTIGEQAAGGFADATFSEPEGWRAAVHLPLVLRRKQDTWRIRQYHVSRVVTDH
jgi:hypothetical protein